MLNTHHLFVPFILPPLKNIKGRIFKSLDHQAAEYIVNEAAAQALSKSTLRINLYEWPVYVTFLSIYLSILL